MMATTGLLRRGSNERSVTFRLYGLCVLLATPSLAFSSFEVGRTRSRAPPPSLEWPVTTNVERRPSPSFHHHHRRCRRTPHHNSILGIGDLSKTALLSTAGGDSSASPPLLRTALLAEAVGTFLIVHLGCGTVCAASYHAAQVGLWQIAAAWSLAVAVAIHVVAPLGSGAHLNPAVTAAMTAIRGFPPARAVGHALAQTFGAVVAATLNYALFQEDVARFEAAKGIVRGTAASVASAKGAFGDYFADGTWRTALAAEASGTFVLALVVFSLTHPRRDDNPPVPLLVGATVGALISVLAPLSGAGFNPARDVGPRIVTAMAGWGLTVSAKGLWVYVLGPVVGAVAGGWFVDRVLYAEDDDEKK